MLVDGAATLERYPVDTAGGNKTASEHGRRESYCTLFVISTGAERESVV